MTSTQEITFEIVPVNSGLEPAQRESLQVSFASFFQRAEELKEKASAITDPKDARSARLEVKKVRTEAENTRKKLKEESLRMGKAIDGANNILLALIVPIEESMEAIEKAAERAEHARITALVADRTEQLQAVGGMVPNNLSVLTDDQFASILKDAIDLQQIKAEREAKEEEDRLAKIEADRLERIRIEAENAKLKAEAEETARLAKIEADRIAAERATEQRKAMEESEKRQAEFAAERAKAEEAARVERDKLELDLRQAEADAAKARKQAEYAAAKAKEEADAIAAERAKGKAAEEAKLKAERAAAAKAAKAPDADKLNALLDNIKSLPMPTMATDEGNAALTQVKAILNRAYSEIKHITSSL